MGPSPGSVIVITGIMAAGKSTVAQALAERLPMSVHLRGDLFRRMIVNGQAEITPENWDAAQRQVHLRQQIATDAAKTYADNGFAVCYQDVVLGTDLDRVVTLLDPDSRVVHVVVLTPSPAIVVAREAGRGKSGYGEWTVDDLDRSLRTETPRLGYWLDTSGLSVEETVDQILSHLAESRISGECVSPASFDS